MLPDMGTFNMSKSMSLQICIQKFSFSAIISFLNSNLTGLYSLNAVRSIKFPNIVIKFYYTPKIFSDLVSH